MPLSRQTTCAEGVAIGLGAVLCDLAATAKDRIDRDAKADMTYCAAHVRFCPEAGIIMFP